MSLFNMHTHLSRDVQTEKLIFPKPDVPDAERWANLEHVIAFMDAHDISHIATTNVMNTRAMLDSRLRRAREAGRSEAAIAEARVLLREDLRHRMREMNDWSLGAQAREPRIRTYIALDPTLFEDETIDEVDRCIALGATGIKIHPQVNEHAPDHPALLPVYARCEEGGVAILACTGLRPNADGQVHGAPQAWATVLRAFPRLRLVLSHFCDDAWRDRVAMAHEFPALMFDISGGLVDASNPANHRAALPFQDGVRVFREVGTERLMWGSDTQFDPLISARQVLRLPLTDREHEQILSTNALAFFGVDEGA